MPQKTLRLMLVIFGIMSVVVGILSVRWIVNFVEYGWYPPGAIIAEFREHQSDFVNMAAEMLKLQQNYQDEPEIVLWRAEANSQETSLTLSSGSSVATRLAADQEAFLKGIADTFASNEYFNRIVANDRKVAFIAEGNSAAIVYSLNDERPRYMLEENGSSRIKVVKLDTDWYLLINR